MMNSMKGASTSRNDRRSSVYSHRSSNDSRPESSIAEPKFGRGKKIHVWLNGEGHCYNLTINPNEFRSWNSILRLITNTMKPVFGAVTRILALNSGQFIDHFDALDTTERYVALGPTCKLKRAPGGYRTSSEKDLYQRVKLNRKFYSGETNKKVLAFLDETERKNLTIVFVLLNGEKSQTPVKLVLCSKEMRDWVSIYRYLTKIMEIHNGISCICTIYGDKLKTPFQLQHGYLYVAVPFKQEFVHMDYLRLFNKHFNKYRSSYTVPLKRVVSKMDNSNYYQKNALLRRDKCPKSSLKQIHQAGRENVRSRSVSQQTGRVVTIDEENLPKKSDYVEMERRIRAELEKQWEAREAAARLKKLYSRKEKQTMTCFKGHQIRESQYMGESSSSQRAPTQLAGARKETFASNYDRPKIRLKRTDPSVMAFSDIDTDDEASLFSEDEYEPVSSRCNYHSGNESEHQLTPAEKQNILKIKKTEQLLRKSSRMGFPISTPELGGCPRHSPQRISQSSVSIDSVENRKL